MLSQMADITTGDVATVGASGIYFSPYRISTITCNANIGNNININLGILFDNIKVIENVAEGCDKGVVWVQFMKNGTDASKGVYPKKRRKSKKNTMKKNRFDNQVTVIYKFHDKYIPNVKIFKNGNIQLTGIKDVKDTEHIVNHIIGDITEIYNTIDKNIILNVATEPEFKLDLKYQNFKIRMINTDFKVYCDPELKKGFEIRRKEIHKLFINDEYNNKCSFQPGIYQGVKLEYFWNINNKNKNGICSCPKYCYGKGMGQHIGECKKVTGALFESGSVLITGGITFEQVDETYKYICDFLVKHKDTIKKPSPNTTIALAEAAAQVSEARETAILG
jgi:TATA-box binding protein (TBP) (component of TFIID and TFIIIB)